MHWQKAKCLSEVAGVTFSNSDSAPVPKVWNAATLQIWESDTCSDSGYNHWSNRNLPMFLPTKWPHRLLLLPKWKSDSGSGFLRIFDSWSGYERKTQNPAGVDSGKPDLVPPLVSVMHKSWLPCKIENILQYLRVICRASLWSAIARAPNNICDQPTDG